MAGSLDTKPTETNRFSVELLATKTVNRIVPFLFSEWMTIFSGSIPEGTTAPVVPWA
jgi:hypothetical protein